MKNSTANIVDANYIVSVLKPEYSQEGSSRRKIEEAVIDNFQDLLMRFEDENLTGYSEMLAWNCKDKLQETEPTETNQLEAEERPGNFQSAVLNPPGVLGSLTGQQHKPVNGDDLSITVLFDHDCAQRNPCHTICFPVVSA